MSVPSSMNTQRSRQRGRQGDSEIAERYKQIKEQLDIITDFETQSKELGAQLEAAKEDFDTVDLVSRQRLRHEEDFQKWLRENVKDPDSGKDGVLADMILTLKALMTVENAPPAAGRSSNSRTSAVDYTGGLDTPTSTAENKVVRKVGNGRTSSQPPRASDSSRPGPSIDANERAAGKPKVTFTIGEEVAFKRKGAEGEDWIQGVVTRIIGEGKSRRYEVKDPFPDEVAPKTNNLYKSSASQMVPVPPEGSPLPDFELHRRVLALYPETTTFYGAKVMATLNDGANVQLCFDDENGAMKIVARRMVLDFKTPEPPS